jgi:hypothetical protein
MNSIDKDKNDVTLNVSNNKDKEKQINPQELAEILENEKKSKNIFLK